jgi:ATP-dependent DNA ligase
MQEPSLLTYPARPVNGGHLKYALPKVGQWSYEPKYNGWRAMLHVPTGAMWNRHGKRLSIASEFATAVAILKRSSFEWLDVEALARRHALGRGSLLVLDCPGVPFLGVKYEERRAALYAGTAGAGLGETLLQVLKPCDHAVYIPPVYGEEERDELWRQLQDVNRCLGCEFYEGLVAKRNDSLYPIQLNSPDQTTPTWMKHRFIK